MRRFLKVACVVAGLSVGLAHVHCNPVLSVAPPGTSITLIPNPCAIPSSGGVSVISALLVKGTGLPVADGTVVQFFTDLGTIDREGKTNDGVARVNLTSDGRSGTATITALSGGAASSGTPAPTAAGLGGGVRIASQGDVRTTADVRAMAGSGGCTSAAGADGRATVPVTIGAVNVAKVLVAASPGNVAPGQRSLITATVVDGVGDPVPNIGVIFSLRDGTGFESLASGGAMVFTDNNGQAQDVLRTSAPPTAIAGVFVDATAVGHAAAGTIGVSVNGGVPPRATGTPTSTATATASATVTARPIATLTPSATATATTGP
jgi:hypothetical protein